MATSFLVGLFGVYAGPIAAAILAGPVLFVFGWFVHRALISRVTGAKVAVLTLGIDLVLPENNEGHSCVNEPGLLALGAQ